ncbi:MAG: DUF5916 domain-containing protein [Gemmatimonadota bacterium]
MTAASLVLLALLAGPGTRPGQSDNNAVYHGRRNEIAVQPPRLPAEIRLDGDLSEPVWGEAALLTGFSQYRPVDGLAADDSTEVLVWYSEHDIHFGIRAFERHGPVNATLADRDRIGADDYVMILLDTFNDRRRALVFMVNPLGVQADGVLAEGSAASGHSSSDDSVDQSPDFVFDSRGRVTPWGYEIEVRIPFKSIRYQADRVQTWGINIVRQVQHSGHQQTWTPVRRDRTSFLAQSGTLESLTDLRRGLVLDLNPVTTARADGAAVPAGGWDYDADRPEIGANVRWGVTANLTMNGTVNPDFSQIESDVSQLSYDPRQALYFPEKRPFFLEASENFNTPNSLIYTRRIAAPVAAAKFTGKVSGLDVGLLSAVDDDASSSTGDHPVYNLLRLRRDIGTSSTAGIVYTDRVEGERTNRVAAADARLVFGGLYSVQLQGGASFTQVPGRTENWRPIFTLNAARRGRRFGLTTLLEGTHDEFRAASGFVTRPGIVHALIRPSLTRYGEPGALVESSTTSITLDGTWLYDRFMNGVPADDQKLHLGNSFTLRGGWRLSGTLLLESFKYPAELYRDYWIDTGTDTVPYTGTDRITNYDVMVNINSPQFSTFSTSALIIVGRDENFFEWAPAWVALTSASALWRPTDKLRVDARYALQGYWRTDWSAVGVRHIPRLKLEYQVSRPVFVRLVGEYDMNFQDDLRDASRTERPVLFCQAGPLACQPARGYRRGRFRTDALFSYQPTPGTVFFAGYGASMGADDTLSPGALRRSADGFFLKLSYLFRM